MRYYMTTVQFEMMNEAGRIQKTKEHYLVEAVSPSKAEEILIAKFSEGMAEFRVIKVTESNLMGVILN